MGDFNRSDYYEIREDVKNRIKHTVLFDFSAQRYTFKFSWKNIWLAWSIINKTNELEWTKKLKLAAKTAYFLNLIDDLEKANPIVGKYCAFSSVHNYEALLTSYFQKKNIKTYALQHGVYSVLRDNITLDLILYENFMSDFHLCWGQFTKDEFINYGIDKNALLVAGYPRQVVRPQIPIKLNRNKCLLLLTSHIYQESNNKLLNLVKEFEKMSGQKIEVHVKIHPNSDQKKYERIIANLNFKIVSNNLTLTDLFKTEKFGWAVAINSAAYYEAFIYNIPCLRYNDSTFEESVNIHDDIFSNIDGLKKCHDKIPFEDSKKLKEYFFTTNQKLNYAIGIDTDEYAVLQV